MYYKGNGALKENAEALKWFREVAGALTGPDYQFDLHARGDPPSHEGRYTGFGLPGPRALTSSRYRFCIFAQGRWLYVSCGFLMAEGLLPPLPAVSDPTG